MKRRGAMELSVGTIVVLVLAMTMLIMGIVLVRGIFKGAKYNIDILDQKVRGEINKLFTEESSLIIYLANNLAEAEQGESFGAAFGFKNLETGTTQAGTFSYDVIIANPEGVKSRCGVESSVIEGYIVEGKTEGEIPVRPGEVGFGLVRFSKLKGDIYYCHR